MNILTGMIVEKAVGAAAPDRDELILQQRAQSRKEASEFTHLCKMLDAEEAGNITWDGFKTHMENEAMVAYMASLGLAVHEVELFFQIVAGTAGSGGVPIDQFVDGCMQMKGGATGIDMQRQLFETNQLHATLQRVERACLESIKRFERQSSQKLEVCVKRIEDGTAKGSPPGATSSSELLEL